MTEKKRPMDQRVSLPFHPADAMRALMASQELIRPLDQVRAVLNFCYPDDITPTALRVIHQVVDENEKRIAEAIDELWGMVPGPDDIGEVTREMAQQCHTMVWHEGGDDGEG